MPFFEASKILSLLIDPLNAIFLLLLIATLFLWRGKLLPARRLLTLLVTGLVAVIVFPIGNLLLLPLEERFPQPNPLPAKVDGIIMLGGAQQPRLTRAHGQPAMNGRAERMTTFLALARQYPGAKLLFSGGSGEFLHQEVNEADTVRLFLQQQGFDADRVVYESRSRNTYENAVNSKALAQPKAGETWLLVTSAADVPRAVGIFRKIGWPVLPFPCDYNALRGEWAPNLALLDALSTIDHGLHEWIGLAVYYLTGKTSSFFPAPEENQ